ncbi:MAG: rod shape-determining protein MreD [Clostridiales Family XIII bacterium]|jgi:rod shape-determining protein MreD|nr:rod shape-determining protein MreD [Clostridiales Family XIII bacterium]
MRTRGAVFFFAAAFVIQATLLRGAAFDGVSPNLLLSAAIVFAFLYEKPYGLALGAAFGLLWDLNFGIYVGVSAISVMCAALAMMLLKRFLNHELVLPALVGALMASALNNAVYWGIYKLLGIPHSLFYILKPQLTLIAYNTLLALALHLVLRRGVIRHRRDQYYKGGFREVGGFRFL